MPWSQGENPGVRTCWGRAQNRKQKEHEQNYAEEGFSERKHEKTAQTETTIQRPCTIGVNIPERAPLDLGGEGQGVHKSQRRKEVSSVSMNPKQGPWYLV